MSFRTCWSTAHLQHLQAIEREKSESRPTQPARVWSAHWPHTPNNSDKVKLQDDAAKCERPAATLVLILQVSAVAQVQQQNSGEKPPTQWAQGLVCRHACWHQPAKGSMQSRKKTPLCDFAAGSFHLFKAARLPAVPCSKTTLCQKSGTQT